ncbi:MAG: recombinase family protein [Thermodesulfobacteriota bacterium]
MEKAALYARVSTETQAKQETISSQLETLRDFAAKQGYTIVEEYVDDGWSGELLERPALDKLRDDATSKKFDVILIHSPDRLARKFVYQEIIREELQKIDVDLVFLNRPIGKTPEDQMLLGMQGLMSEYEKAKILERTRRGKLRKARDKILLGGFPTYGYQYFPKSKDQPPRYEIIDEHADVIRLIFDLFVNHQLTQRGIVREVTKRNIPTPKGGKKWGRSTVARILRNETYAGTAYYNKNRCVETDRQTTQIKYRRRVKTGRRLRPKEEWIPIPVPPIISKELFNTAQNLISQNRTLASRNNKKHQYLLRGLIKCGICGFAYYGNPSKGKTYYRCSNRHKMFPFSKTCNASTIQTDTLDPLIWKNILRFVQDPHLLREKIKDYQQRLNQTADKMGPKILSLEEKKKKLVAREKRNLDMYEAELISLDQLKERCTDIKRNISFLEQELEKLKSQVNLGSIEQIKLMSFENYCNAVKASLPRFNFDQKRELLTNIIKEIIIEKSAIEIRGFIPFELEKQRREDLSSPRTAILSSGYRKYNSSEEVLCPLYRDAMGTMFTSEFWLQIRLSDGDFDITYLQSN